MTASPRDVWLPFPAEEVAGLPDSFRYRQWDGEDAFPADPADCVFYVAPYMKSPEVTVRPLAAMPAVRVVQTLTAGIDDVLGRLGDLRPGVRLCNAAGVHTASTAELALALTLASLRGIPGMVRGQDREDWRSGFYDALADKSVLIIGYGSIGSAVEDRLVPFECERIERVARSARTAARGPVHAIADLPRLLPQADVVILVTPLTDETRGLAGAAFLGRMKDGALLVNVSRGPVVDTKSLLAEVESGRLRAALDVTDPEPLPAGHPLWHAPNVLITPHVGGSSSAFEPRAKRLVARQLTRFAAGEPVEHTVLITG
ncbi:MULTISPECIES: 2-hydroxyacid dehydrogenase [Streptomyces]|uniref:Dehydrogenase n=1 Tax=Streptomyces virginiae TaxID=1961 RepID=A0ABQ3NF25_STRVG|nr:MULTISPECIES: 2-hydroxyacid dehydrogenase [Streptomyces]GLV96275.1 dehydrogenase [Streptomyces lavendulae subsp. lavendulae]KOU10518.1 dihydrofolate reductase [Streptomyces sp. WM6349]KOU99690.1 dihydrofolate reductase [Streptomyces sp. XY511]KOV38121.1 dihydrofolate reductase [Streptomyces sp. H036]MBP2346698.1 phosphoglycerate dehydrogenase-like enzyme [Streptomyces virginiae]